jgi:exosortase A
MIEVARDSSVSESVRQDGARQAFVAGGAAVLSVLVFGGLFPDAALAAIRVWLVSPTFNHCFLVLPISLFMIWNRRRLLADAEPVPDLRAALIMPALAIIWLGAAEAGVLEAQQLAVVTMVQATLWAILGNVLYRKLAAPFLYLYFLVPTGAYLVPALQSFTAQFAVAGLHLLRIPVFSNGAVIEIPAGSFAIAEACAGLRFLVASVAFGVFFAVITYRSWLRRAAFVALSIVVPIIANGFRALGLIAAAQWIGNPAAAMADHIIYGWIFFSFVLIMLILLGQTFSDQTRERTVPALMPGTAVRRPKAPMRIAVAAVVCFLAAASGPAAAIFLDSTGATRVPAEPPPVGSPWRESSFPSDWTPIVAAPARTFRQSFVRGPDRFDRFIALYAGRGRGNNAARLSNRDADERIWSFDSAKEAILTVGRHTIPVHETVWLRQQTNRIVWSFYIVGGNVSSNIWNAKWNQFHAYLTKTNCVSAYVALSTQASDQVSAAKAAQDLLSDSQDLETYLCGPTTDRARR